MAPTIVQDYQQQLIQTILDLSLRQNWWSSPLNLGGGEGPGGGSGVPIGDIFGQLIQSKVAFDTTEAAVLEIPISGASLVTNLDRIRYRIGILEASGIAASGIILQHDDAFVDSGVTILNFEGAGVQDVATDGPGKVTVTISGGGGGSGPHTLGSSTHTDVEITSVGNNEVLAYDSGSGDWINQTAVEAGILDERVKVSSNDTTGDFLEEKLSAGAGVTFLTLNEGGDELLEITTSGGGVLQEALHVFEDVTSQIPPNNDFYIIAQSPLTGSVQVHVNGLLQLPSYYTPASSGVFLTETLLSTDEVIIEYIVSGGVITNLQIFEDGGLVGAGVTILDFVDVLSVTVDGETAVITHSGSGGGGSPHALGSSSHTDVIITSVTDNEVLAYDDGSTDWINQTAAEAGLAAAGHSHPDELVKVTSNDSTADFLFNKIVDIGNITITELNDGSDEDAQVAFTTPTGPVKGEVLVWDGSIWNPSGIAVVVDPDELVKISSNDTTAGFVEAKFVEGSNVTFTTLNEGGNETFRISTVASGTGGPIFAFDEGILLTSGITSLDWVGPTITATTIGNDVTVTVTPDPKVTIYTSEGDLTAGAGSLRMYNKFGRAINLTSVFITVDTAPTGSSIIVDVHLDGTTIFTTQSNRPEIAVTEFTDTSGAPELTNWAVDSFLQMDIDQVGSTITGADLTVHVIGD